VVASVRRIREGWQVRWHADDGKQKARMFGKKVDADRWAAEVEHKKATGTYIDPAGGQLRFGEYAEQWLALQVWRPSTRLQAETNLRNHALPAFGHRPLSAIRTSEVQAWVKRLSDELAPSTVTTVHHYVRSILKAAVRDRLIASSPCTDIRLPKQERPRVVPLEVGQVGALASAVPERWRAAVLLAAGTGLRQGEVFGLTLGNVHLLRRMLTVDHQLLTPVGDPPLLGPPKTPASYRTVPMPQMVIDVVAAHLAHYPATHEWGLIFTTEAGGPVRRNRVGGMWQAAARKVGLPGVTFHSLRHHYASLLIRSGCSVKAVQEALGHATAAETLDTYAHLWPSDHELTRAAVDEAWAQADVHAMCTPAIHEA
jgi:integrase